MPRGGGQARRGEQCAASDHILCSLFFANVDEGISDALLRVLQVVIITNSDEGWVDYSAERYLPNLIPVLKNYRVISARTRYEKFYPSQPLCWKAAAFAHEANEHFCSLNEAHNLLERECSHGNARRAFDYLPDMEVVSTDESSMEDTSISSMEAESPVGASSPLASAPPAFRREIVSFGDSIEERTAVKIVSDQLDAQPKSVMFLSNPTPTQIVGQLTMLTHHMQFVCEHSEDLDMEISQKQADKCAQGYLARKAMADPDKKDSPSLFQRILGSASQGSDLPAPADGMSYAC